METVQSLFNRFIASQEELRAILGEPRELAKHKIVSALNEPCRDFIARSPFLLISTANAAGECDVSPRGDAPGFVRVLDEKHLVIPERPGNRLADTLSNIIANSQAGLLFIIPGIGQTLRVNGRACVFQDREMLEQLTFEGKTPQLAIGVEVEQVYMHCAKAFIRSHLWEKETWPEKESVKTMGQILESQVKLPGLTAAEIDCAVEESYRSRLY